MSTRIRVTLFVVALCAVATIARAQGRPPIEIAAGAAAQSSSMSFLSVRQFPYFAETARLESDLDSGNGIAFDLGALIGVVRRVGFRFGVTRTSRDSSSEARGRFPHPFFFNTDRTGTWSSDALDLTETAVHVAIDVRVLDRDRLALSLFGGPTWFIYKQGVIADVEPIENYPYDTIDARVVTSNIHGTATGFHAGVDASWFFSRHVGVGGVIRYAAGRQKDVRIGEGEPFNVDLGGAQGGGGIRIRF
jgi:hypothetical protein